MLVLLLDYFITNTVQFWKLIAIKKHQATDRCHVHIDKENGYLLQYP